MDKVLISVDDLARYRPTSKVIPLDRIQPFIREAQIQDLEPAIGDVLYNDFISKYDDPTDPMYTAYQELLSGKYYTPINYNGSIEYQGIIPMLCYFSLARFYENNQVNATAYGLVQKNTEYGQSVSPQAVQSSVEYLRSLGVSYQHKVIRFIYDNQGTYPLWTQGERAPIQDIGVKFFSV